MIFEERADVGINTTLSVYNTEYWESLFGGMDTDSGVRVTENLALSQSVVFRCVTLVASIGSLPMKFYRRRKDGGKEEASGDALWRLLHDMPNREMTAVEFWEMMFGHAALRYNAFAQIIRDQNNVPAELWPLNPTRMEVERKGGVLRYNYTNADGGKQTFGADDIYHLRGMMSDGLQGISPFTHSKNAVGIRASQEQFQSGLLKNRAAMPFVYLLPGRLKTNEARQNLEKELHKKYHGSLNAGKAPVLEQGLDIKTIGMSAEDAQALEQAKFSVAEIARYYGVPLHKLMELDRATFSNIEEQNTDWVVDTVRPWAKRAEAAVRRSIIPPHKQEEYFVEFLIDDLLRGNTEDRWNAYQNGLNTGVFSINDVRQKENLNPIDNGDTHLVPLNMIPLGLAGAELESEDTPPERSEKRFDEERSIQARLRLRAAYKPLFRQAYERVVRREVNDIRNNLKKLDERDETDFSEWLAGFYEELKPVAREVLKPVSLSYAQSVADLAAREVGEEVEFTDAMSEKAQSVSGAQARSYAAISQNLLEGDLEAEDPKAAIDERLSSWDEGKAETFARESTVDTGEAMVRTAYAAAGVMVYRWATLGDSCPLCKSMNGKTVRGVAPFAHKGMKITGEGTSPLTLKRNIGSPPLHTGCDCMVRPGI